MSHVTLFAHNVSLLGDANTPFDESASADAVSQTYRSQSRARARRQSLSLSRHAQARAARRNVVFDAVDYVLAHGRMVQRTGATFYFLGKRDIPVSDRRAAETARLAGTVVLVASTGEVITVYRNQRALPVIRRKLKYRLTPEQCPAMRSREDSRRIA
jgi:hypothetical protein